MNIDGTCHCGEIAWEAEINPDAIMICHCTDCQMMSGGAFRWGTLIPKDGFALLRGKPKFYRKIAASGSPRLLAFCGTCGTSLYGTQADQPISYSLRLSGARQADQLHPTHQMWTESALPWLEAITGLPKIGQPHSTNLTEENDHAVF